MSYSTNPSNSNLEISPSDVLNDSGVFDFEGFFKNIQECLSGVENDDVELGYYLLAYEELYNFFVLLGGAFQFVAVDVKNKIKILTEFRSNENKLSNEIKNFSTVKSMVNHEISTKCFENSKYVSGSRTLLRLHRGLDFIRKFLSEIYQTENHVKLGGISREVYDLTLAEYHTWIVKNAARVAMKFLPTRIELLNKISENNEEKLNYMLEIFPEVIEKINVVYDRVQKIYSDKNILDLP